VQTLELRYSIWRHGLELAVVIYLHELGCDPLLVLTERQRR